jgi:LuxR family maltose regulon positive regulatory protein
LQAGLSRRLTLISAPAGFGKTTLLCEWLNQASLPAAWVSLDEGDNEPRRFLAYLTAALRHAYDVTESDAQALAMSPIHDTPVELPLTALINDFAAAPATQESPPRILVLDDYHFIHSPAVHQAMTYLLEHMPQHMHLIITSRTDPPLPLPRLRARGQLNELRSQDLRFTRDEAAAFLNEIRDLRLSPEQVAALEGRTEGWIAGLRLAALAMSGRSDVEHFVRAFTGSHRYILDYLVDEVFQRQPEAVQEFLLKTSVLDRMTASLCDAVTGQADGHAMLDLLERENIFVVSMDDQRRWYRYHHLFADLLRDRLERALPDAVPDLQQCASRWHAEHDQTYEAIGYALAAKDYPLAIQLVEQASPALPMRGEVGTLLNWLNAFPPDVARASPRLMLISAWACLFKADVEAVEARVQDALHALHLDDKWPEGLPPDVDEMLGQINALRAFAAVYRGQPDRAVALAENALGRLRQSDTVGRSSLLAALGDAHRDVDNFAAASQAYSEAAKVAGAIGQPVAGMALRMDLARLLVKMGQLRQAEEISREALDWGGGRYRPLFPVAQAHVLMGDLLRERNELDRAEETLSAGIRQCELGGYMRYLVTGYVTLARVKHVRGDLGSAMQTINEAGRVAEKSGVDQLIALVGLHRARLDLAAGDAASAMKWAQRSGLAAADAIRYPREDEYLTLARILVEQSRRSSATGALDSVAQLLSRLLAAAEKSGRQGSVIEILLLQALSRPQDGLTPLRRALSLAEPEGYARLFVDEGPPMADLLLSAAQQGQHFDYISRLLKIFRADTPSAGATQLADPLTGRELEVLRLLAVGRTNQEIADQLVVSLSTVKTHITRIYDKLDAGNRMQAVARAREWGLL